MNAALASDLPNKVLFKFSAMCVCILVSLKLYCCVSLRGRPRFLGTFPFPFGLTLPKLILFGNTRGGGGTTTLQIYYNHIRCYIRYQMLTYLYGNEHVKITETQILPPRLGYNQRCVVWIRCYVCLRRRCRRSLGTIVVLRLLSCCL
jgi:hypothetical protein